MATFKVVISDPKSRKAYQKELDQDASGFLGKRIGENVPGLPLGLDGYALQITGGSDKEGFPMRHDVAGTARKRLVLSSPPGYHAERRGQRKRKSIRGNTVSADIVQINAKVVEYGKNGLDEAFGKAEKAETKTEHKADAKPAEAKKAEKPAAPKEHKPEVAKSEDAATKAEAAEKKMGVKKLE
ncbi:MAG: 30S ribosomal protein S6e [Candidatus Aenigmarchaeota archaeon]|nr:30S ribosomal protein S6e [Candidatus Aenigmarchaeota archaeon]